MLFKGQITQQRKKPIWLFVISLVFISLCSIYIVKSHNFQASVEVFLRIAPRMEETGRRRVKIVSEGNAKNFNVSRNSKSDIFLPIEKPNSKTTTILIT